MNLNWLALDQMLFSKINGDWTSPFFDWFFPHITDLHQNPVAIAIFFSAIALWVWKKREFALKWLLVIILAAGFTDLFCYRVVKSFVDRDRPEMAGMKVVLRTNQHSGPSFPSNHAANMFAVAVTFGGAEPAIGLFFYLAAVLIAYSRVYVGVHFPLDVIGGAAIGIVIGYLVRMLLTNRLGLYHRTTNVWPDEKPTSRDGSRGGSRGGTRGSPGAPGKSHDRTGKFR